MNITENEATILKLIEMAQKDPLLELECIIKSSAGNKISREIFNNVIKKIKGIPNIKLQSNSETLDIFLEKQKNMRYTINGNQSINKYCKSNNLSTLNSSSYDLITKRSIDRVDLNNYNLRSFTISLSRSRSIEVAVYIIPSSTS